MSRTLRFISLSVVALLVLAPAVALCDSRADAMPCCPDAHGPRPSGASFDSAPGALDCCVSQSEAASSPALYVAMKKLDAPAEAQMTDRSDPVRVPLCGSSDSDPPYRSARSGPELSSSLLL